MRKNCYYCDACGKKIKKPDTAFIEIHFEGSVNIPYIIYEDNRIKVMKHIEKPVHFCGLGCLGDFFKGRRYKFEENN